MFQIGGNLKRRAILVHGWMGVGFCSIFLMWFTSGIVLIYCDFPAVSSADQLAHIRTLDPSKVQLSADQAFARLKVGSPPVETSLSSFAGRPAYRFRFNHGEAIVYADDGETQATLPLEMMLLVASAWTTQPAGTAAASTLTEADQWTVSGELAAQRPLRKFTWPDGKEVYVSMVTGDVVQCTTRASRIGAYFGAIPHWLYFTPIRRHSRAWSRLVICVSGLGIVVALLGLVLGISVYSSSTGFRRSGSPSRIPYAGQKRWHMILGLLFGPVACLWVFSGMLSMEPFPKIQYGSSDGAGSALAAALKGAPQPLAAFKLKSPRDALLQLGSGFQAKELQLASFRGVPAYLAIAAENQSRVIPIVGEPTSEFDRRKLIETLSLAAAPHELTKIRDVASYEAYYSSRRNELPLPVISVELNDSERSVFYVNPKSARIVQSHNSHTRLNRWLYHGIHSLDLPGIYNHRRLRDLILLVLMVGGTSLSFTSVLLACRILRSAVPDSG
jgi:hypothetical protein